MNNTNIDLFDDPDLEAAEGGEQIFEDHLSADALNLCSISSEHLCEVIVAYRYLGVFEELAISYMEELSKRRDLGDKFEYEKFIDEELKKLPNFDLNLNLSKFPFLTK